MGMTQAELGRASSGLCLGLRWMLRWSHPAFIASLFCKTSSACCTHAPQTDPISVTPPR